jgi:hypothetical protein
LVLKTAEKQQQQEEEDEEEEEKRMLKRAFGLQRGMRAIGW